MNVKLIATTAMGLESIAAQEVRDLGYKVEVENGKVIFEGDSSAIARSNLWLRVADRVKLVVGEFKAYTDRKSTRLNSSHVAISYAVFCLKKKTKKKNEKIT